MTNIILRKRRSNVKIFITGGTGSVGQYTTKALLDAGHEVVLLTRTPDRIPELKKISNLTLVEGSTQDMEILKQAVQGCNAVIYFALTLGEDPYQILMNDTRSIMYLMVEAEKAGVECFIYTSSEAAAIYDPSEEIVLDEKSEIKPGNLYCAMKAASEAFVRGFSAYLKPEGFKEVNMRRNIVRPGHVYADPAFEGGSTDTIPTIEMCIRALIENRDIELPGYDGGNFIAGKQLAQLYLKILESNVNEEIYFGAGVEFVSYWELAERIREKYIPESTSQIIPVGKTTHISLNSAKMNQAFDLRFTGQEYMDEHIEWILDRIKREQNGEVFADARHSHFARENNEM
jgi:UDP-glucose 4-epimerase